MSTTANYQLPLLMSTNFDYKYFPTSPNISVCWESKYFYQLASLNQKHPTCFAILILVQAGDLNPNPGPYKPKFPCAICEKAARWDQRATCCDQCNSWYHVNCMGMSTFACCPLKQPGFLDLLPVWHSKFCKFAFLKIIHRASK